MTPLKRKPDYIKSRLSIKVKPLKGPRPDEMREFIKEKGGDVEVESVEESDGHIHVTFITPEWNLAIMGEAILGAGYTISEAKYIETI